MTPQYLFPVDILMCTSMYFSSFLLLMVGHEGQKLVDNNTAENIVYSFNLTACKCGILEPEIVLIRFIFL